MQTEPVTPCDLEAEMIVLGNMLVYRESAEQAMHILKPGDFHAHTHEQIFTILCERYEHGDSVNIDMISDELSSRTRFTPEDAREYLENIQRTFDTIAHYAQIVRDKSAMRQLFANG